MLFFRIFLFVCLLCSNALAQYSRKQLQPAFFIPNGELAYQEILPPIIASKPKAKTVKKADSFQDNTDVSSSTKKQTLTQNSPEKFDKKPLLDETLHPDYKEKYDDYLKDLDIIGTTGEIPKNETLENDLKKMNSDSPFVVP